MTPPGVAGIAARRLGRDALAHRLSRLRSRGPADLQTVFTEVSHEARGAFSLLSVLVCSAFVAFGTASSRGSGGPHTPGWRAMSRFIHLWLLLGLVLTATPPARAQLADVDFAEELVRADYVEGLPYVEARELTPAGVERLIEMLRDPGEAEH